MAEARGREVKMEAKFLFLINARPLTFYSISIFEKLFQILKIKEHHGKNTKLPLRKLGFYPQFCHWLCSPPLLKESLFHMRHEIC